MTQLTTSVMGKRSDEYRVSHGYQPKILAKTSSLLNKAKFEEDDYEYWNTGRPRVIGHYFAKDYLDRNGEPVITFRIKFVSGGIAEMRSDVNRPHFETMKEDMNWNTDFDRATKRFALIQAKLKKLGWKEKWV